MIEALLASIAIAAISLLGVFFFRNRRLPDTHGYILPIAVGVFLGVVFFELIPETIEMSHDGGPIAIVFGFLAFYLLSHVLRTYHHHHCPDDQDDCVKGGATKLLIGDAVHNIADGVVIASAFLINPALGIATTVGIALHEIPQEIAEFGVLIQSGYTKKKAALLNLLSALSIVLGVLLVGAFSSLVENGLWVLTGLAAGNLLYIATADFIPELQEAHHTHFRTSLLYTLFGLAAVFLLFSVTH